MTVSLSNQNPIRQRLKDGDVLLGPWCVIPSAAVMNITASAGFDFVIVDLEHSPTSFETAEEMVRAAQSEGVPAVVRLGAASEDGVLRSLDIGSDGIICAHVESAKDAREVAAFAKYWPDGQRGFSPFTRAGRYSSDDITTHAEVQNERTMVGVILEGKAGIDNLAGVLETPNLDLVYVGAYDLSQAMGMPGQVAHPEIRKALERCIRQIRDAGVAAGGFVARNRDDMMWMIDMGMQFITYLPDCTAIHQAMRGAVDDFRKVLERGGNA
jgi:4-hydroxy-2-oxoheptanedioate aldolase